MNRAGATLSETTSESRTVEPQVVAQCVQQRHVGIVDRDHGLSSVNIKSHWYRHDFASRGGAHGFELVLAALSSLARWIRYARNVGQKLGQNTISTWDKAPY